MWGEGSEEMMTKCTWRDCREDAKHSQVASDGEVWASLCDSHEEQLIESYGDVPRMLSAWVCAQGGAAKAAKRMTGPDWMSECRFELQATTTELPRLWRIHRHPRDL